MSDVHRCWNCRRGAEDSRFPPDKRVCQLTEQLVSAEGCCEEWTSDGIPGGTIAERIEAQDLVEFAEAFEKMSLHVHTNAKNKGWWDREQEFGTYTSLLHSEISEAFEAYREGNGPDKHIPEFRGIDAEMADLLIRLLDIAVGLKLDIAGAMVAKHMYNKTRPERHGGKVC